MNIEEKLNEIWSKEYINSLPEFIKERGFCFSVNDKSKDILITGINPSFRVGQNIGNENFDFQFIANDNKHDNYWSSLKNMIYNIEEGIDLRGNTAYLDIFYFREKTQKDLLKKQIFPRQHGIQFVFDQLNLTQHLIEDIIKPKVIIVKNKESAAYWGKLANEGIIWMGYELEFIENTIIGDLYKIIGLIESTERIAPEIKSTNLKNTLVLFSHHITQFTKREKRPTAIQIRKLLESYNC